MENIENAVIVAINSGGGKICKAGDREVIFVGGINGTDAGIGDRGEIVLDINRLPSFSAYGGVKYLPAPYLYDWTKDGLTGVFLSGSCQTNWREGITDSIVNSPAGGNQNIIILNPYRADYLSDSMNLLAQADWEIQNLSKAEVVVFWFEGGSGNPLSAFELGLCLSDPKKKVIVGIDYDYVGKNDLEHRIMCCKNAPDVVYSIDELEEKVLECLMLY